MTADLQLNLGAFDRTQAPLCDGRPDRNGFLRLCYQCPLAARADGAVFCEEFGIPIRVREKYGLRGWREVRTAVLDRDGRVCAVCCGDNDIHIHHINLNPTNDDPANLVALCSVCHARVHTDLRREGGAERVAQVMAAARRRKHRS